MGGRAGAGAVLAGLLLLAAPASGLDPRTALTQYGHTAWRVRDGVFAGELTALAQTRDGFLWIGTQNGLLRFDGVRFTPWEPPPGSRLPDERIISLLGARDGSLWIGTANGLARWQGEKLTVYAPLGRFGALLEDRRGTVWMGHTRALERVPPLCRFERERLQCFRFPVALGLRYVGALHEDPRGEVWIGGETGVCRWREEAPAAPECHPIAALVPLRGKSGVFQLADGEGGGLLAATTLPDLWHLGPGGWERSSLPASAEALLSDREKVLWLGLKNHGLLRRVQGRTETFDRADGLSGDEINHLFEDREGSFWVATPAGLDRFRDVKVTTLTPREGLPGGKYTAVAASRDGGVWIAEQRALLHLGKAGISSWGPAQGLPGNEPTSLLEDSRGRLWLGVDNGLAWLEGGRFSSLRMPDGGPAGIVRSLVEARDGQVWAATTRPDHNVLRVRDERVAEAFPITRLGGQTALALAADPAGGVWLGLSDGEVMLYRGGRFEPRGRTGDPAGKRIHSLHPDARGLWVATSRGLSLIRGDRWETLDARNGLPCDFIESVLPGEAGALWVKAACGLIQIPAGELDAWMEHPERRVRVQVLDAFDGAQAGLATFTPRAARSLDGRLWFAQDTGGVQVADPAALRASPTPPPVAILRAVADRRTYQPAPRLRLPPLTRDLEIDYTALSLAIPEKVRFRYLLEGADGGWQDAGTRREAFYTNLGPGTYRFRVLARNRDGLWNEAGAAMALTIPPAFYQTRAFLALCAAALLGLAAAAYRWRLRELRASLDRRFEERLAERMRIAQDLHDTLLQGLLSASMQLHVAAGEVPADVPARPRLDRVLQLMAQVIEEGRNALRGLRSADTGAGGLEQALARTRQELGLPETAAFRVVVEGRPRPLRPAIRDEVYRIGREALVNAFRHAGAAAVEAEIEYAPRALRLLVRDDGAGIDPEVLRAGRDGHWGLSGMRERAEAIGARLDVWSRPGTGTEVELTVPGPAAFQNGPGRRRWWPLRPKTEDE